jgi:hypothetical protein
MACRKHLKTLGRAAAITAVLAGALLYSLEGAAGGRDDDGDKWLPEGADGARVLQGYAIAPVKLNIAGKNWVLVGLGSYLINSVGDCNGCHSGPPGPYLAGGDPAQGQPTKVNKDGYLAGGNLLFGPFFVPRNLTPDKTGLPAGGASYEEFRSIIRTGIDPDQAHLQFGPYLQVMPWPNFRHMTERDIRAMYEYLRAIPCVEGDPGLPDPRPLGTRCKK